MKRSFALIVLILTIVSAINAQDYTEMGDNRTLSGTGNRQNRQLGSSDSTNQHKEIPRGLKVWTVDEHFGDKTIITPDTLSDMYMNSVFNTGLRGEYNSLGNLGSPRQNRIFIDRKNAKEFLFLDPYDQFIVEPGDFHFTSTLSPITNLSYNGAGNRTNGEDHFKALFAVNAGKRWGFGFKFDYLYGRGYYSNQNTSHTDYSMWGSYMGERYLALLFFSLNHQKVTEGGGITNDAYITHPEKFKDSYRTNEIPTVLEQNWNRNDNQHIFFTHRYNLGFYKKIPMTEDEIKAKKFAIKSNKAKKDKDEKDKARKQSEQNGGTFNEAEYDKKNASMGRPENAKIMGDAPITMGKSENNEKRIEVNMQDSTQMAEAKRSPISEKETSNEWMKNEYIPVTSFIHTTRFSNYRRIYQAYQTPDNYYANNYFSQNVNSGDSIYDMTKHWALKNTVAVALLEGFNKWAKAGLKAFVSHELRHYELPSVMTEATSNKTLLSGYEKWNQQEISVGGQLLKTAGKTLHYDVSAEAWIAGHNAGDLQIDGHADVNFPLLGDTVQLAATAFFHRVAPSFYMDTFRSSHYWWDNSLDQVIHSRLLGELSWKKTETRLRIGYDMIKNYSYFALRNNRIQNGDNFQSIKNEVNVRQNKGAISLLTLQLQQDFRFGIINWQNVLTFQKSSDENALPLPIFNAYSNLFIRFKIAKVLSCDLGVDARYFTKYFAPEYIPGIGYFGIQEINENKTKIGNYPVINAYANFQLQHTRFFIMMSHLNSSDGGNYFFTPHYPLNQRIFRFGVSWNFFN
ncbi:hypothetical protein ETF27_08035 [Prevotella brunnea]|uniref:Porin n=1 Tax=Prevotella brunnea TaxID=2508867 RepID=A0A5C8GFZ6_9BACT|nr:putative porin [Prevotella brunnea]MDR0186055.1 hypothetical protein [Prevotella brunnea]TXJ60802.1 hypothetical protein ETF27_08035 [Prevotella brunnea]